MTECRSKLLCTYTHILPIFCFFTFKVLWGIWDKDETMGLRCTNLLVFGLFQECFPVTQLVKQKLHNVPCHHLNG